MNLWTILPVKDLAHAKSRLGESTTTTERQQVALCLFQRTLDLLAPRMPGRVLVVTRDPAASAIAHAYGCHLLHDTTTSHSTAVRYGAQWAVDQGAEAVATLATDLPLLTIDDVQALLRTVDMGRVVLAPDRLGIGTNALAVAPPLALSPQFGHGSFRRHVALARGLGLEVRTVRTPGLAADLDHASDLDLMAGLSGLSPPHAPPRPPNSGGRGYELGG